MKLVVNSLIVTVLIVLIIFGGNFIIESNIFAPRLRFNNQTFVLKFSQKSPLTGGYMNEYYLEDEGYNDWTQLIGVYYFPFKNSPISIGKKYQKLFIDTESSGIVIMNIKEDTAVIMQTLHGFEPVENAEFNIFRYEKAPQKGVIALQYARRYFIEYPPEINEAKKDIEKNRFEWLKKMDEIPIPPIITKNIDKGG